MTDVGHLKHGMRAANGPGDRGVAELARRQHGVVARRQLVALGLGRGAIAHRLATGRLHCFHVGVYAVGHTALSYRGRWMAAVLACGPGAVLSHRSAAAHWGLRPSDRARVDVTVPWGSRARRPGIDVHRVRRLFHEDRTVEEGIPITAVPRTLLDLAEVVSRDRLDRRSKRRTGSNSWTCMRSRS
jgi:predicted transcriptional regulator of viral defense system